MNVVNIHERVFDAPASETGQLLDSLASSDDRLWPHDRWPPMKFDRPLAVDARGGHGSVGYVVAAYEPGRSIRFRFTAPPGFLGEHHFTVEELESGQSRLRHVIDMRTAGSARLAWLLLYRPLHDALLQDALDRAAVHLGGEPAKGAWSPWVRFLRWAFRKAQSSRPRS